MAHNGLMNGKSTAEEFLLEEYKGLLELNKAREERFDRLLTLFLSLAGAPWVLYGFIVKNSSDFSLSAMPRLVAAVFFGAGAIGLFVAMMAIHTRFTVTMYARATNAIRGYFAGLEKISSPPSSPPQSPPASANYVFNAFRLPISSTLPPYVEGGNYNTLAVLAMALVNAAYLAFGLQQILHPRSPILVAITVFLIWLGGHFWYYLHQAYKRGKNDSGVPGEQMRFNKKSKLVEWLYPLSKLFGKK